MFIERSKLHEIVDLVSDILSAEGYTCIEAEWEAHSRTLRLYVDHPNGIDLDACAKVSHILVEAPALDTALPFEFNLEVSSPGIERPVRTLADFSLVEKEGGQVEVKLIEKFKNRRNGVGTITEISEDMISLKTAEGPWTFPWNLVLKATKVVDWEKVQSRPEQ